VIKTLYNIDSKGKIRQLVFDIIRPEGYTNIIRSSGLLSGKLSNQPVITIFEGKAGRTREEQVQLEYNSLISKAKDKGYKDTIEELSSVKTDSNGNVKPMLAKDPRGKIASDISEVEAIEIIKTRISKLISGKKGYLSRKLDGVRMMAKPEGTVSRGGKNYDVSCTEIVKDGCLDKFFEKYPDYLLDGEIYTHGYTLEELSGDARKQEWVPERHDKLQFWIFDIVAEGLTFEERLKILEEIIPESEKVVILEHLEIDDIEEIITFHDLWVKNGYEGAIWREAGAEYKIGGRDNRMLKIKFMQDAEFEITGAKEGLRPEDMVFVLKTQKGLLFEAKPVGNVVKRISYLQNINQYVGKMATIKFFHMSEKGVPNLPIFKCVREDE
jgi:hypothetical protein